MSSKEIRVANQEGSPEIFYTIQGEGRNLGEATVFYRTSGCNLQCVWCDTPYTWNFDGTPYEHNDGVKYDKEKEQTLLTVGQSIDLITQYEAPHLVITGGEPMLQQRTLIELAKGLKEENPDYRIDIETNGTITPLPEFVELVDLFSVSLKTGDSGNEKKKRYRPQVVDKFVEIPHADFKFVIPDMYEMAEVLHIISDHKIPYDRVFLMPEGRTKEELARNSSLVAEIAKEYQFNFTPRLHIDLWGDKRGV